MKIYCNVCNKYRKFENPKISYIFKKTVSLSIVYSKCGYEYEKIFKEGESTEILKILGLITVIIIIIVVVVIIIIIIIDHIYTG